MLQAILKKLNQATGWARLIGIFVIVGLVAFVVYQVYDFYDDKVGYTSSRAVEDYFNALAAGNNDEVYRLTSQDYLTDIYGRPVTRAEFSEQLDGITGGKRMPFTKIEAQKLTEAHNAHYYVVTLYSNVGGSMGSSRLVVEVVRQDKTWVVRYPFAIVL